MENERRREGHRGRAWEGGWGVGGGAGTLAVDEGEDEGLVDQVALDLQRRPHAPQRRAALEVRVEGRHAAVHLLPEPRPGVVGAAQPDARRREVGAAGLADDAVHRRRLEPLEEARHVEHLGARAAGRDPDAAAEEGAERVEGAGGRVGVAPEAEVDDVLGGDGPLGLDGGGEALAEGVGDVGEGVLLDVAPQHLEEGEEEVGQGRDQLCGGEAPLSVRADWRRADAGTSSRRIAGG